MALKGERFCLRAQARPIVADRKPLSPDASLAIALAEAGDFDGAVTTFKEATDRYAHEPSTRSKSIAPKLTVARKVDEID